MISRKYKNQISEPPSRIKQLAKDFFALLVLAVGLLSVLYVSDRIGDPFHEQFKTYNHNE